MRRNFKAVAVLGLAAMSWLYTLPSAAQNYPSKRVTVIVSLPAGASADGIARIYAEKLKDRLGQPVIVENRVGNGGVIGLDALAKAAPDGYTIGLLSQVIVTPRGLLQNASFDGTKDFALFGRVSSSPFVIVAPAEAGVKTLSEFINLAKSKPGSLNYASAGNASANHLATERFNYMTGTKMVHIPFKGGGPAVISIVSGETAILMATIPSSIQHFETGRLRPLGVTSLQRNAALPKIPSINEAGVAGYEAIEWNGIVVPAGTPQAIITRLNQAIVKSLSIPEVKRRILDLGADPVGNSPEEFAAFIKKEIATWTKVIKEVGITVE